MLFSTLCRAAVSLASRENTVISQGTAARSWATMDWRIASSPRLSPPYDPEMPIRYTWSAALVGHGPDRFNSCASENRVTGPDFSEGTIAPVGRNFPVVSGRNFPTGPRAKYAP